MKFAFFAVTRNQRAYFPGVISQLNHDHQAELISHKHLLTQPGLIFYLGKLTDDCLSQILNQEIKTRRNKLDGQTRTTGWLWRSLKKIQIRLRFAAYYRGIKQSSPNAMIIWNGLKYEGLLATEACRQLSVSTIYMENGLLPDKTTVDTSGVNFLNSVPREPHALQLHSGEYQPLSETRQSGNIERDPNWPQHYVFVPFQVNTDSQVLRFSPWLGNMFELVEALLQAERHLGERMPHVMLKTHPSCSSDYRQLAKELPVRSSKIQLLFEADTQALIEHADAVATINSTVGIESLILNKKVIVMGQAFYDLPGLTLRGSNQHELEQALLKIPEFAPNQTTRLGLIGYLQHNYQVEGDWRKGGEQHLKAVSQRLIELASTRQ